MSDDFQGRWSVSLHHTSNHFAARANSAICLVAKPPAQAGSLTLRNCRWLDSRFHRVCLVGVMFTEFSSAVREYGPSHAHNQRCCVLMASDV